MTPHHTVERIYRDWIPLPVDVNQWLSALCRQTIERLKWHLVTRLLGLPLIGESGTNRGLGSEPSVC
jgi:hypothetical protein